MRTFQSSSDKYGNVVYEITEDEITEHLASQAEVGLPHTLTEDWDWDTVDGQGYATLVDQDGDVQFIEVTPFTIEARLVSDLS